MKRLNRKGFTLVELLAVIVILAIVVGITLVTVLPTLKQSRQKAFELTAQTASDYYEKQYQLYLVGDPATILTKANVDAASNSVDYEKAGLKSGNYDSGTYKIDTVTGRVCVKLDAKTSDDAQSTTRGDYYDVKPEFACSSSCTGGCTSTAQN